MDLSDGRAHRKPVIPAHLLDGDGWPGLRRGVRRHLRHQAAEHGHRAAYHGVRAPAYLVKTLTWAVVGFFRLSGQLIRWWHAVDLYKFEHEAAANGLLTDHLRIHHKGGRRAPPT